MDCLECSLLSLQLDLVLSIDITQKVVHVTLLPAIPNANLHYRNDEFCMNNNDYTYIHIFTIRVILSCERTVSLCQSQLEVDAETSLVDDERQEKK